MKDYYLQLGIDPNASSSDIEAALQAKPELSETAGILLDKRRRAAYTRTVSTLRSIGMLRHRLGLDSGDSWFLESCPDFAPKRQIHKYVPPAPVTTGSGSPAGEGKAPESQTRNDKPWHKTALLILAIAVLAALALAVL